MMNILDIFFAVVLAFGLIRGLMVGLVRQVASIAGLVGGGYLAYIYYPVIAVFLANWIENPTYRDVISFILIFISVYLIIMMVARLVQYLMKISLTGWLDRMLGMALGLLKGILVCALLLIGLKMLFPSKAAFVENSILVPYVEIIVDFLKKVIA